MDFEKDWREADFAFVDVETTGTDPKVDRIVEIGIVTTRGKEIVEKYQAVVNPGIEIPPESLEIHKIPLEEIKRALPFIHIAAEVRSRLEGKIFVAYNLEFDKGMISAEFERLGLSFPDVVEIDPYIFAKMLMEGRKKLSSVADNLGFTVVEAHRAIPDCEMTCHILFSLEERLPKTLGELVKLHMQWKKELAAKKVRWKKEGNEGLFTDAGAGRRDYKTLGPSYIYGVETDPLKAVLADLLPSRQSKDK